MNRHDELSGAIVNALSIDVEDYFQVSAFSGHIPRSEWDNLPCRIEQNIDRVLALLAAAEVRATFFTLGWMAERYPAGTSSRAMASRITGLPSRTSASSSPTSAWPKP
jgi:hypothetical protein